MLLDLSADGEPELFFAADSLDEHRKVQLGDLVVNVTQVLDGHELGTGSMLWQAGPELAASLLAAARDDGNVTAHAQSAIELGCGCSALPGLALALGGAIPRVEVTDLAEIMPPLRKNLSGYASAARQTAKHDAQAKRIDAIGSLPLNWNDASELAAMACGDGYDLVIASDVNDYSEVLLSALVDCCAATLSPLPGSVALFATAARSEHCLRTFLQLLRARFVVTELTASLRPCTEEFSRAAAQKDDVRFFCARWADATTAAKVRTGLSALVGDEALPDPETKAQERARSARARAQPSDLSRLKGSTFAPSRLRKRDGKTPCHECGTSQSQSAVGSAGGGMQDVTGASAPAVASADGKRFLSWPISWPSPTTSNAVAWLLLALVLSVAAFQGAAFASTKHTATVWGGVIGLAAFFIWIAAEADINERDARSHERHADKQREPHEAE